jgi:hypothetical protein
MIFQVILTVTPSCCKDISSYIVSYPCFLKGYFRLYCQLPLLFKGYFRLYCQFPPLVVKIFQVILSVTPLFEKIVQVTVCVFKFAEANFRRKVHFGGLYEYSLYFEFAELTAENHKFA